MTTVAYCAVAPEGRTAPDQIQWTDEAMPGLRTLTDAVHAEGAAISAQIGHAGPVADPRGNRRPALSPSTRFPNMSGGVSRKASVADLERITAAHAAAATRAIEAGFDAVEVHLGHSYLASAFLSPKINHRKDEYGGSLANRAKFARSIMRAVRDAVGDRIAILAKLNMSDGVRGGITLEEAIQTAQWIEADGTVDAFEMTAGQLAAQPDVPVQGRRSGRGVRRRHAAADPHGDALRRGEVHPRVPLPRQLPDGGRRAGAGRRRPADDPARRHHRPGRDGPSDGCGLRVRRHGPGAAARARPGQPDRGRRRARRRCASTATSACRPTSSAPTARSSTTAARAAPPGARPPATPNPVVEERARRASRHPRLTPWTSSSTAASPSPPPGRAPTTSCSTRAGWSVAASTAATCSPCSATRSVPSSPTSGTPDPISLSAYFLSPTRPGPGRVQVRRVRTGGRRSTVAVSLVQEQDGAPVERITALATYGDLDAQPADVLRQIPPPELPPVEDCVEARFDTEEARTGGAAPGPLRHPPRPGVRRLGRRQAERCRRDPGLVPARRRAARSTRSRCCWWSTPCRRRASTSACRAGRPRWSSPRTCEPGRRRAGHGCGTRPGTSPAGQFEEDCEVWDSTGRLVAQSRQLALLRASLAQLPTRARSSRHLPDITCLAQSLGTRGPSNGHLTHDAFLWHRQRGITHARHYG